MTELCSSLSVVFTDSPKIEDHLFAKAIRWADQNPDDLVFWARERPLNKIPTVDVDWAVKIAALRRIRFGYNRKNLLCSCLDEAIKNSMGTDVAAMICSMSPPKKGSQMGSLLAALAHFCNGNDGRAVLVIDLREEEIEEREDDLEEKDPFEDGDFLDEEEDHKEVSTKEKSDSVEDKEAHIGKLKTISAIYTHNVFLFDGEQFINCL